MGAPRVSTAWLCPNTPASAPTQCGRRPRSLQSASWPPALAPPYETAFTVCRLRTGGGGGGGFGLAGNVTAADTTTAPIGGLRGPNYAPLSDSLRGGTSGPGSPGLLGETCSVVPWYPAWAKWVILAMLFSHSTAVLRAGGLGCLREEVRQALCAPVWVCSRLTPLAPVHSSIRHEGLSQPHFRPDSALFIGADDVQAPGGPAGLLLPLT